MSRNLTKSRVSEISLPSAVTALPIPPEQWVKELTIHKGQITINVNRLRYKNIPLKVTSNCQNAGRDELIQVFWQSLITSVINDNSCYAYFTKAAMFLKFSDEKNINIFTSEGVNYWIESQHVRVLNGGITEATASSEVGALRKFISLCELNSTDIIPQHNPFSERARGEKDIRTQPYTKKEEKQLLKTIENLYQQLKEHLINTPEQVIAQISYENKEHYVPKLGCRVKQPTYYRKILTVCVFYKLAAYTGYNPGTLTNLKHSQVQKIDTANGHIFRLSPTKGRKGGAVDSKDISTPKHIALIDEWLAILPSISDSTCEWFFPVFNKGKDKYFPLHNINITDEINDIVERIYHPISEKGNPLKLSASRFRKNRNLLAHYIAGPIMAAHDANHSVAVEDRFYGTINPHEGMKQTAASIDVLAQLGQSVNEPVDVQKAKQEVARKWNIELLPLEDAFQNYGSLKPMPNGIRCKNGYEGVNPEKYQRIQQKTEDINNRKLPCALYESCLSCSQALVIDKNYGDLLSQIDTVINLLSKEHVVSARGRVFEQGLHLFWNRFNGSV